MQHLLGVLYVVLCICLLVWVSCWVLLHRFGLVIVVAIGVRCSLVYNTVGMFLMVIVRAQGLLPHDSRWAYIRIILLSCCLLSAMR
jgi:hypothetical protein